MLTIRASCAAALLALALSTAIAADTPGVTALLPPLKLTPYRTGTMPPPFTGQTLDSRPLSLEALRGKVVLLNFWASWCADCRPEMPVLERLHRELASKGLVVLGINAKEDPAAARRYADAMRLSFPLAADAAGTINESYGVVAIPTTFLIARDGRAVAFGVGPRDWGGPNARELLDALLAEPPSRESRR